MLTGCTGIQSALDPAGREAEQVAALFWTMLVGGAAIWAVVIAAMAYAMRQRRGSLRESTASRLVLWGGAAFPAATLFVLLAFALWLMPNLRPWSDAAGAGGLRIEITGKQFWWQVVYHPSDGSPVVAANEVRLPVGERVEFVLKSDDVIHSFWIPSLGGKLDMIPGRTNRLALLATKAGIYRGPCTEFCGTSHALMAFPAIAMEPAAFRQWLSTKAQRSRGATQEGLRLFLLNGCGACHRIAGTEAAGAIGPDLSHVGSRLTVGAGILPNTEETLARFIAEPDAIKPGIKMPAFGMLPPGDIRAIAAYLKGLE